MRTRKVLVILSFDNQEAAGKHVDDHVPAHELLATSHDLNAIRNHIDAVDSELVRLLATRLALVVSAAGHKSDLESVADPERVSAVLERTRASAVEYGTNPSVIEEIYRVIIGQGIGLEKAAYHERSDTTAPPDSPVSFPDAATAVTTDNLLGVMATMRAMRRLADRPVAQELLDRLVQAASWAPVGANRQGYKFVIVTDRAQLERLAPHWSNAMELYLAALCPSRPREEALQFERVRIAMAYQCEHFAQIPALIVVCYEPVSFWRRVIRRPWSTLRHLWTLPPSARLQVLCNLRRWASRASAASVYPAVENLLLAARAHGLGATLTTWHSAFENEFKDILEIPKAVDIYAVVPVGYPLGNFGPVRRRPVEDLVDLERWRGV